MGTGSPRPQHPPIDESAPPPPTLTPPAEFEQQARDLGVEFEPGDVDRLGLYLALLLEANKTHNLTAITDPAEAWSKHILDALTLVGPVAGLNEQDGEDASEAGTPEAPADEPPPPLPPALHHHPRSVSMTEGDVDAPEDRPAPSRPRLSRDSLSIIDVGSGGGVPAIPLAIVFPDIKFTLLEATGKKAEFLSRVKRILNLRNVRVLNDRSEKIGQEHKVHREKYDAATARALGHLAVVAELTAPLVKPHGVVLAVKGAKADQELEEAHKAFGMLGLRHVDTLATPTGRIVVLEKTTRTPRLYPRKDGEPKRKPLGIKAERKDE